MTARFFCSMKNFALAIAIFVAGLASLSCEKEKNGIVDSNLSPPFISSEYLIIQTLDLDTTTGYAVTRLQNGSFRISDSIIAQISDDYGLQNINQVVYRVYPPGSDNYIVSGSLNRIDTFSTSLTYANTFSFTINRAEIGAYKIEVFAQDLSGLTSNCLQVSLVITRRNSAPRLSNLSAPDTLIRPTSGYRLVFFTVTASDSDGLEDIERVYFRSLNATDPNYQYPLFDDGDVSADGDSVAGDGRFSQIIPINKSATLGTKLFRFYVLDRSHVLGDSLDHYITIVAQ